MTTSLVEFTKLDFPIRTTVPTTDAYVSIGRTEYVRQRKPTTGQVIEHFMTAPEVHNNPYGGAFAWGISPAYTKIYSGPVVNGLMTIKELAFSAKKLFS